MRIMLAAAVLFIALGAGSQPIIHFATKEVVSDVIVDKERINASTESFYLIYGENEVYRNSDTVWAFKYNSSDVQKDAVVGKTCDMTVTGFRVPFSVCIEIF